jgi:hypothetical protein
MTNFTNHFFYQKILTMILIAYAWHSSKEMRRMHTGRIIISLLRLVVPGVPIWGLLLRHLSCDESTPPHHACCIYFAPPLHSLATRGSQRTNQHHCPNRRQHRGIPRRAILQRDQSPWLGVCGISTYRSWLRNLFSSLSHCHQGLMELSFPRYAKRHQV